MISFLGDDPNVKKGKPEPDIFLEAAKRLISTKNLTQLQSEEFLVFEDAPSGVEVNNTLKISTWNDNKFFTQAALNAKMQVCMVPDSNLDLSSLPRPPHQILQSLELFQPSEWGLPVFDE